MKTKKIWCMMVRIKKNDNYEGKRMYQVILDILRNSNISGATVWTGVAGFGKRGDSNFKIEGISINMPLVIEVIEDISKVENILPEIKKVVGDNGLVTLHEIDVI
jgi:hypothetical protein